MADAKTHPQLPPDIVVESQGQGEERKVLLDVEGTTFHFHPDDARVIGECLIVAADDATEHENG